MRKLNKPTKILSQYIKNSITDKCSSAYINQNNNDCFNREAFNKGNSIE